MTKAVVVFHCVMIVLGFAAVSQNVAFGNMMVIAFDIGTWVAVAVTLLASVYWARTSRRHWRAASASIALSAAIVGFGFQLH